MCVDKQKELARGLSLSFFLSLSPFPLLLLLLHLSFSNRRFFVLCLPLLLPPSIADLFPLSSLAQSETTGDGGGGGGLTNIRVGILSCHASLNACPIGI